MNGNNTAPAEAPAETASAPAVTETASAEAPAETASAPPRRKKAKKNTGVSQLTGTGGGEMRQDGLQIDGFGLPVNGIARRRVLKELGADDPIGGGAWENEAKARKLTEKFYG